MTIPINEPNPKTYVSAEWAPYIQRWRNFYDHLAADEQARGAGEAGDVAGRSPPRPGLHDRAGRAPRDSSRGSMTSS